MNEKIDKKKVRKWRLFREKTLVKIVVGRLNFETKRIIDGFVTTLESLQHEIDESLLEKTRNAFYFIKDDFIALFQASQKLSNAIKKWKAKQEDTYQYSRQSRRKANRELKRELSRKGRKELKKLIKRYGRVTDISRIEFRRYFNPSNETLFKKIGKKEAKKQIDHLSSKLEILDAKIKILEEVFGSFREKPIPTQLGWLHVKLATFKEKKEELTKKRNELLNENFQKLLKKERKEPETAPKIIFKKKHVCVRDD